MKRLRSSRSSARRRISCFWRLQGELRLDARQHHREVERLGDVVVGAEPQRLDDVLGRVAGGGHDDGQVRLGPALRAARSSTSMPESPGIMTSSSTRSKACRSSQREGALAVLRDLDREARGCPADATACRGSARCRPPPAGARRRGRAAPASSARPPARAAAARSTLAGGGSSPARGRPPAGAGSAPPAGRPRPRTSSALRAASRILRRSARYLSCPASWISSSSSSA